MGASTDLAQRINAELDELREMSKQFLVDEVKSGGWFDTHVKQSLEKHAGEFDAEYFSVAFMDVVRPEISQMRLEAAKRRTALEGAISSGAYNGTVKSVLGGDEDSGEVVLPDAVQPFLADLLFTTRLQLQLAHDLCVIHGRTPELDDPWDLYDLMRIAFGQKAGEVILNYVQLVVPEVAQKGLDREIPGMADAVKESMPMLGKHLMRRNIIKYIIPVVSVPLNAGLTYYFVSDIPHMAGKVLMERAAEPEIMQDLQKLGAASPKLLLEAIWLIIIADEKVTEGEQKFVNNLTLKLTELEGGEETIRIMEDLKMLDEDEVVKALSAESEEVKKVLFDVICDVAAIDHKIHRKEKKVVKRLAEVCGQPFDMSDLKKRTRWG